MNKGRPFTMENDWWFFFGYGVGWPPDKCNRCTELVEQYRKPNRHCIDCWKLEIFFSNCVEVELMKEYMLKAAKADHALSGKWLKEPLEFTPELKERMTSIPEAGHPDPEITKDGVILIYAQSIAERDRRLSRFLHDFEAEGLYRKGTISYRRGCVNFDEIIGSWKTWWPLDRDYDGEAEVVEPSGK